MVWNEGICDLLEVSNRFEDRGSLQHTFYYISLDGTL